MSDKNNTNEVKENNLKEIIPYVIVILVVILIKVFIVTPIRVNGESMFPTLHDKDFMILNEFIYKISKPKRFDIVVVKVDMKNVNGKVINEKMIKRVIGLPGDVIEYKDNKLYVNDQVIEESFLDDETKKKTCQNSDYHIVKFCERKITVPEGLYFVMGDNRGNSVDGRRLGFMELNDIMGKAQLTLFPFDRIGLKK